jgi:hypothetical protein
MGRKEDGVGTEGNETDTPTKLPVALLSLPGDDDSPKDT